MIVPTKTLLLSWLLIWALPGAAVFLICWPLVGLELAATVATIAGAVWLVFTAIGFWRIRRAEAKARRDPGQKLNPEGKDLAECPAAAPLGNPAPSQPELVWWLSLGGVLLLNHRA